MDFRFSEEKGRQSVNTDTKNSDPGPKGKNDEDKRSSASGHLRVVWENCESEEDTRKRNEEFNKNLWKGVWETASEESKTHHQSLGGTKRERVECVQQ